MDYLNSLQDWAQKWCMNFNPSKCTVLHINRPALKHNYQLKGETLLKLCFYFFDDGLISISNSEQKEQTNIEKYVFYCSVSEIHI